MTQRVAPRLVETALGEQPAGHGRLGNMTDSITPPQTPTATPRARAYLPCDGARAAALLGISLPAWDVRRARATLWFELGGAAAPIATGTRPRNRAADALPLVGVSPPYLGVCLPGTQWVFDERAVSACRYDPLYAVALIAQPATQLADVVRQMRRQLEAAS